MGFKILICITKVFLFAESLMTIYKKVCIVYIVNLTLRWQHYWNSTNISTNKEANQSILEFVIVTSATVIHLLGLTSKVSYSVQCIKKQLITLQNFNIETLVMHRYWCVLTEVSMEIGMVNFWSVVICLCNGAWNSL